MSEPLSQGDSLVGEKLGSFRIESVLGSGAGAVVYRSTNEKNGRAAAVKVLSADYSHGGNIRDRFEREAEILQQLRHPNIPRFLAVGRFSGTTYLAMEYIAGETWERVLRDHGHFRWYDAVKLAIQLCDALHYVHSHGVVHRALNPSNLMVSADGQVKLIDFGSAKDLDATALTGGGLRSQITAYTSPEQIRGSPAISHKTDLYAFGCVLYEMLTGEPPFADSTEEGLVQRHLAGVPPMPSAKVDEIPSPLDKLILKLMAKAPQDRPRDAAAVGMVLARVLRKAQAPKPSLLIDPAARGKAGSFFRMFLGSLRRRNS
jgi:serine/threonine protein kinase